MKLCFATLGCPGWTIPQIVKNAGAMGFDGVELRGAPGEHIGPDEPPEVRASIRQQFQSAGLHVACIMGYSRFTHDEPEKRQADVDQALKFLHVAKDIGCPTLRVFGGRFCAAGQAESLRRVVEGLRQVAPTAERLGVKLALETHDDWCKGVNLRAVLEGVGSPALGVCWDIANAFFVEPLETTFALIRDRIVHVHFKDAARGPDGKVHSVLPGQGQVDMALGLKLLHEGAYRGWLSFEWEKKWEPELAEPEVAFPHYVRHVTAMMGKLGVRRG